MKAVSTAASTARHTAVALFEALLILAIIGALIFGAASLAGLRPAGGDSVFAKAGGNGNGYGRGGNADTAGGSPTLALSCDAALCTVGGTLTVTGTGFIPSSGGQMVFLWVGYPNDFCADTACHGFYFNPWVGDDGSFSVPFDNVLLQAGAGQVSATQYDAQRDKWAQVAAADYSVQ